MTASGEVVFKKYSPLGGLDGCAGVYAEALAKSANVPVAVCDKDHVIAAAGMPKKELLNRRISSELSEQLELRRTILAEEQEKRIHPVDGAARYVTLAYPILADGDAVGYVLALSDRSGIGKPAEELLRFTAALLTQQLAE